MERERVGMKVLRSRQAARKGSERVEIGDSSSSSRRIPVGVGSRCVEGTMQSWNEKKGVE